MYNDFTSVSVNLDGSEAMIFYSFDEIDKNPNPKLYQLMEEYLQIVKP